MTTIETLTLAQVEALSTEAGAAGDTETVTDCETLIEAYNDCPVSELAALVGASGGEVREAARRIVNVLRNAEAQV